MFSVPPHRNSDKPPVTPDGPAGALEADIAELRKRYRQLAHWLARNAAALNLPASTPQPRGRPMMELLVWRVLATSGSRGNARTALTILALRADAQGLVEIAQAELARLTGVELETIRKIVAELKRRGELAVVRKGAFQYPGVYRVIAESGAH